MQTWTVPELRRRLAGKPSCVMFMTMPVCNIINLLDVTSCGQLIPAQLTDNVSQFCFGKPSITCLALFEHQHTLSPNGSCLILQGLSGILIRQ